MDSLKQDWLAWCQIYVTGCCCISWCFSVSSNMISTFLPFFLFSSVIFFRGRGLSITEAYQTAHTTWISRWGWQEREKHTQENIQPSWSKVVTRNRTADECSVVKEMWQFPKLGKVARRFRSYCRFPWATAGWFIYNISQVTFRATISEGVTKAVA